MPDATVGRRVSLRTTVATAAALACGIVPAFLFAALSGQVRQDLGFGEAAVGAAVTMFFVAGALAAVPAGRVTERLGPRTTMLVGATVSGTASIGIGLLAGTWWHLTAFLAVSGAAVGLIDTGAARALANRVGVHRHGLAFGVKEASVPAASMLAGFAVPALGLTIGWRPTFVVAAVLVPLVWLVVPRHLGAGGATRGIAAPRPRNRPALVLLAAGAGAGTGAATATASFLVPSAVAAGIAVGSAGLLLAAGSALGIATRLFVGWRADRVAVGQLPVIATLMAGGTLGMLLLAASGLRGAMVVGALVAIGAGWGWTGLVFLSAVRAAPETPAAAAGIILAGLATGGALGPVAFGALVAATSYPLAWLAAAVTMAAGAVATVTARRQFQHPATPVPAAIQR